MSPYEELERFANELLEQWSKRIKGGEVWDDPRGAVSVFRSSILFRRGAVSQEDRRSIVDEKTDALIRLYNAYK
jgi:hypothetical protein